MSHLHLLYSPLVIVVPLVVFMWLRCERWFKRQSPARKLAINTFIFVVFPAINRRQEQRSERLRETLSGPNHLDEAVERQTAGNPWAKQRLSRVPWNFGVTAR